MRRLKIFFFDAIQHHGQQFQFLMSALSSIRNFLNPLDQMTHQKYLKKQNCHKGVPAPSQSRPSKQRQQSESNRKRSSNMQPPGEFHRWSLRPFDQNTRMNLIPDIRSPGSDIDSK